MDLESAPPRISTMAALPAIGADSVLDTTRSSVARRATVAL